MGFYEQLAATAKSLLVRFGRDVTRRRHVDGTYDPDSGTVTHTPSDTTFKGALFDFGVGTTEVRGTLVLAQDKNLLLEAAAAPLLSDVFVVGGVTYSVVSIGEVNPAGSPVVWEVHLRRV